MVKARDLLLGAVDLHQHLGPSIIPRELDIVCAVKEAKEYGLVALTAKDHQFPTIVVAEIVEKYFTKSEFRVFSGIALNNTVGGWNLEALETAIAMGAKFVWMPTVSTKNHHIKHSKGGLKFPKAKKEVKHQEKKFIKIINEDGSLVEDAKKVLKVISENKHLVLSTGHGNAKEVDAIINTAVNLGIENIIVNHPAYMIDATIEQMIQWSKKGAYIEIGVATSDPISKFYHVDIKKTIEIIKTVGAEKIIIGSDCGQKGNVKPVEGLEHFITLLMKKGIKPEEIELMIKHNPKAVTNMESR